MEGLEVNEIKFSSIEIDNEKFRLDDEFFQKKYLNAYKLVKAKSSKQFSNYITLLTDYHANGAYENLKANVQMSDEKDFAYIIRSTDFEKNDFDSDIKYISKHAYEYLAKTKLYGGELLINKIGTPGKTYLMPKLGRPASVGMNLFMIRTTGVLTEYLYCFFNTEIGKKIIERKINGTVPLTIDKEAIKSLYIPFLSEEFQEKIKDTIQEKDRILYESKQIYRQAEELLLEAIGLKDFQPKQEGTNIKSFKESFLSTGRLDAEYYQPKYEEIVEKVKQKKYDLLGNLVNIKKSIEPGSDVYSETGLPFIRVSDYNQFGTSTPDKYLSDSFCKENADLIKSLYPKKETILFSKDGSVGTAYMLRENMQAITSGAILHLTVKDKQKVLPEYLTLALNSEVVKQQAERDAGGSIILHWRVGEIENVVIPIVDYKTQQQIAALVEESFCLRHESEQLLERAKQAVEVAIEKGEQEGMGILNER